MNESESIKRIRVILEELINEKRLQKNKIAGYLGLEKRQYWAFYKFLNGDSFPRYLEPFTGTLLEKLRNLLESPELIQTKQPDAQEDSKGYEMTATSFLVWIPLDLNMPVVDYNGTKPPLSLTQMADKMGIVTFRSTSKYDADGELYIDHIGMATDIEPGTRIAIRRIDKIDWQPDRYYVIIDASGQISVRELLPGDDEKTVRYVSTGFPEGPHRILQLERIEAIFSFVDGHCIPKPKRNNLSAPAA
jgi:hypothetical protein